MQCPHGVYVVIRRPKGLLRPLEPANDFSIWLEFCGRRESGGRDDMDLALAGALVA